jgi:hypothetical protein
MFEGLAQQIDELDIPVDSAALVEVHALVDRLAAKVCAADAAFDKASLWDVDAATSMTAWLRRHAGMTSAQASAQGRRAGRLDKLAGVAEAWADGRLSGGQVAAILGVISDETIGLFAEHEAALVPALAPLSVVDTVAAMRDWQARAEAVLDRPEPPDEPTRNLHLSATLDGRWALDGSLDVDSGQVVAAALRMAATGDGHADEHRTPGQRRADALVDVCRHFLDHQQARAGGRHRPHINIVIPAEALDTGQGGHYIDGTPTGPADLGAWLCDSAWHRVIMDSRGSILDYGMATRDVPVNLFNAVAVRDRHCRFPGCDRPADWCDAHHVVHYANRGPTAITNLALLCRRHHRRLHRPDWDAQLHPMARCA